MTRAACQISNLDDERCFLGSKFHDDEYKYEQDTPALRGC